MDLCLYKIIYQGSHIHDIVDKKMEISLDFIVEIIFQVH
jgi:hypothetical protein